MSQQPPASPRKGPSLDLFSVPWVGGVIGLQIVLVCLCAEIPGAHADPLAHLAMVSRGHVPRKCVCEGSVA